MSEPLTDRDEFPFGKWKGHTMASVPADYLDWCSRQDWISKWPRLKAYIEKCRKTIDAELRQGIGVEESGD